MKILMHRKTIRILKKVAQECDTVILAWGKGAALNQRISGRADQVLGMLEKFRKKLYLISDGSRSGLHPLTPSIRTRWILEPFEMVNTSTPQTASK